MSPRIRSLVVLVTGLVGLGLILSPLAQADELRPGHAEGEGTHFEVADSGYFDIAVDSGETIWARIDSIPGLITIEMQAASDATSAVLAIGGLAPLTTYYAYEDNYHNGWSFITDESGSHSYLQDLSVPHRLLIQPTPSTHFVPSDPDIGWWDPVERIYTLTEPNVTGTIQIDESDLSLNGAGHSVTGTGSGSGVYIGPGVGNVTVENLHVQGFTIGINVYSGGPTVIRDNDVHDNAYGIATTGLFLLEDNVVWNNTSYGIFLYSTHGTATGNAMFDNTWNLYIKELGPNLQMDLSNTVDGQPVYYVVGETGANYDASTNAGAFYAYGCNELTIQDLTLPNAGQGVFLRDTHNSTIENVQASNALNGIQLSASTHNTIIGNTLTGMYGGGIRLDDWSTDNLVADNSMVGFYHGISLSWESDHNTLTRNTTSNGHIGIVLSDSDGNLVVEGTAVANGSNGMGLTYSSDNVISGYKLSGSPQALGMNNSHRNTFTESVIDFDCGPWGTFLWQCNDNQFYRNNFIDECYEGRIHVGLDNTGNQFNLPAPIGGNYWSGWTDPDADNDGFVDLPYVFEFGQDDLPWATPNGWVEDPAELIAALIDHVLSLNLQNGIENSLDSKLDAAVQAIEDVNANNDVAAINALQAFINAVQAQSGNHIPEADALDLEIEALEIIELLMAD